MFPDRTLARAKSTAGRYGREMEVMRSSTVAAKRNTTPGTQNARDVMWDSDEREEDDAWKCISREFIPLRGDGDDAVEPCRDVTHVKP